MNCRDWSVPLQRGLWILNTIFHQGLAVVMMYTIWIPIDYSLALPGELIVHIILCTIGLIILTAEALVLFAESNVWSQDLEKTTRYWMHGVIITIGTILIIAGIAVEISRPKFTGHFESDHGITGLVALIFICISLLMGLLAVFSNQLSGYVRPVILKFIHNLIGIVTYILSIAAFCLGYYTEYFKAFTTSTSRNTATVAAVLLCIWSLNRSFVSAFKQIKSIENIYSKKGLPLESLGVNRPTSTIWLDQGIMDTDDEKENL